MEWLKARIPAKAKVRLAFESALELMAETRLGTFKMDPSGKSKGPPPAVKKVLSLFGSGRVGRRRRGEQELDFPSFFFFFLRRGVGEGGRNEIFKTHTFPSSSSSFSLSTLTKKIRRKKTASPDISPS